MFHLFLFDTAMFSFHWIVPVYLARLLVCKWAQLNISYLTLVNNLFVFKQELWNIPNIYSISVRNNIDTYLIIGIYKETILRNWNVVLLLSNNFEVLFHRTYWIVRPCFISFCILYWTNATWNHQIEKKTIENCIMYYSMRYIFAYLHFNSTESLIIDIWCEKKKNNAKWDSSASLKKLYFLKYYSIEEKKSIDSKTASNESIHWIDKDVLKKKKTTDKFASLYSLKWYA